MATATKQQPRRESSTQPFDFRNEAGASLDHNRITRNLSWLLWQFLKDNGNFESFTSDLPVFSAAKNGVYYPDLVVSCSPEYVVCDITRIDEITDEIVVEREVKALTKPKLIVEVWSDSNNTRHKATKLEHYEQITSLDEYLTVEQSSLEIRRYLKTDAGKWKGPETINGEDASLTLDSFELTLSFKDIYARCRLLGEAE